MTKPKLVNRKNTLSPGGGGTAGPKDTDRLTQKDEDKGSEVRAKSSANDDYIDSQFQKPPGKVPHRSIGLAVLLCCAGTILISLGFMVISGHLDAKFEDRAIPMVILGFLMFIPGAYHVRIFVCALKGIPGYSFEDIPEFE